MDQNRRTKVLEPHKVTKTELHFPNCIVQALCSVWLLTFFSILGYWNLTNDCVAMLHPCLATPIKNAFLRTCVQR